MRTVVSIVVAVVLAAGTTGGVPAVATGSPAITVNAAATGPDGFFHHLRCTVFKSWC